MKIRIALFALAAFLAAPLAFASDATDTVLLVAKRNLHDRLYGATVIVARPLGEDRHLGFIVNKPTNMTLGKLFPKHPPSQKVIDPVYLGGPTGPEVIFALVKGSQSPGGRSLRLPPRLYVAYHSSGGAPTIRTPPQQARVPPGTGISAPGAALQ